MPVSRQLAGLGALALVVASCTLMNPLGGYSGGERDAGRDGILDASVVPDTSTLPDASPPDASPDSEGGFSDSSTPDASEAGGDAAPACYDPDNVLTLTAAPPVMSPSLCTAAQISAYEVACTGATGSTVACTDFTNTTPACARCLRGPLTGDNPATTPVSALLPISAALVTINIQACGALVMGRADCAIPVSKTATCLGSACIGCTSQPSNPACQTEAAGGICAAVGDPTCWRVVSDARSTWNASCQGASFSETLGKVGHVMCGPP